MSSFRQLMMKKKGGGSPIPAQYEVVDYIQSSGTQYIDTGVVTNQNTILDTTYVPMTNGFFIGGEMGYLQKSFDILIQSDSLNVFYNTSYLKYHTTDRSSKFRTYINKNVSTFYLNDVAVKTETFSQNTFSSTYNLCLFALNRAGSMGEFCSAKIYSCDIYENDVILRSFVPVFDTINQVYGLYDVVGQQFYGNVGSGNFTGGND